MDEYKILHPHRTPGRRRHHRHPGCGGCGATLKTQNIIFDKLN